MSTEIIEDEDYGPLTWDEELYQWRGHASMVNGIPFRLSVTTPAESQRRSAEGLVSPDKSITQESRLAFRRFRKDDASIRASIADQMSSRYSAWNGEEIAADVFQARLQLDAVRVYADGAAEIYYLDDDMFFGHGLIAHLLPDGAVRNVEMFG